MSVKQFNADPNPLKACALFNKLDIHNEISMFLDAHLTPTGRAGGKVTVEFNSHHHSGRGLSIEISPQIMKGFGIYVSYFNPNNSTIVFDKKLNILSISKDGHKFDLSFEH